MTTVRPVIVIEGSQDGSNWLPYRFNYITVDLDKRPPFVGPHQPRLDWQIWFAALSNVNQMEKRNVGTLPSTCFYLGQ
jgi:lipase maturation factor 1